jgi:phosphoglycerate dehydrogenase-like enzyme
MRIAILDDIHQIWSTTEGVARLRESADVTIFIKPFGEASALKGFDVLIANRERTRFDRELLEQLADAKIIVQTGNHANHLDFVAAKDCGINVGQASAGYSIGAAELAIGLTLAVSRQIPQLDAALRRSEWPVPLTPVLHGKTFGVIGLGRVGAHAANIARAFGMSVIAWSPHLDQQSAQAKNTEYRELDALLSEADVVSIHTALKPETRGLIDAQRLSLMKPSAYLVNTARGPIVDEKSLVSALEQGIIAGAGLDVFDQEPLPKNHPLTRLPNVVLTPHIGWPTDDGYARFAASATEVILAYRDGQDFPKFDEP